MDTFVAISQTYSGRDKLMRTAGYACILLTGAVNPQGKTATDLRKLAGSLSAARTMMRFFDDIPMWKVTRASLFSQEKDIITKALTILANVSIQCYFPIEKIAWAADNQIIPLESANWWTAGVASWAICLVANLLKNIRALGSIQYKKATLIKQRKLEAPDSSSESAVEFRRSMAALKRQEFEEYVAIVKNAADITMAVNWLPKGFLWAGKISPHKTAFFGVISSLIGMINLMVAQKTKKN